MARKIDNTPKTSHFLTQKEQPNAHRDPVGEIYQVLIGSPVKPRIKYALDEVPQFEMSKHQKNIEQCFNVSDLLKAGAGGFGSVFKCKDKQNGEKQFAVKVIKAKYCDPNYRAYWTDQVKGELAVLKQLRHANIVEYHDHCWLDHSEKVPRCYLVIKTECLDQTLYKVVKALRLSSKPMEFVWFKRLFQQICTGLVYMHDHGFAHHDLKHINIMIKNVKSLQMENLRSALVSPDWKIIDLGTVHYYSGPKEKAIEEKFFGGTTRYSCPDKRNNIRYQPFNSDSYSLGMLCWEAIEANELLFVQPGLDANDPDYVKKLKPAWEIIDSSVMPKLKKEGKVGLHHTVARKLIAPEKERISVSDALELFNKEERRMRGRSIELNKRLRRS